MINLSSEASICFWIKITDWNTKYATFFQAGLGGVAWNNYIFGFLRNNGNSNCCFTISDGSSATNANYLTPDLNLNEWYHIGLVYKTRYCLIYINGVLYQKYTTNIVPKFSDIEVISLGVANNLTGYQAKCKLNDIRIYNHALSPFEIKQISQGLILHYPLNNNGFGQENLLIDTLKDKDKIHTTYGISDFNFSEHLVEGEEYTVTASVTTSSEKTFVGIYHSGGSYSMSGWMKVNEDGFYQKTFTATANMANRTQGIGYGFCRVYVSNNPAGGQSSYTLAGTANVNWIKIEKGNKATPWCPNEADKLYKEIKIDDNIEYDCSGFNHNGEKIKVTYTSDSPKYDVSSVFISTNPSIIKISNSNYAIQGSQNMTWSIWAYKDDWSQFSERVYSCTEGGGLNIQPTSSGQIEWAVNVYTDAEKTSHKYDTNLYIRIPKTEFSNGWHMFTWVYTTSGTSLYIDGILKQSKSGTSYGIYFHSTAPLILGGQASGSSYTSPYLNGKLSDFRVYTTALSAEDILALYKNSVYLDNEGSLYGVELREI